VRGDTSDICEFAGGVEHQLGGGFGSFVLGCGQHAGVGVGGQHDTGMPELIGNGLQISTGQVCQRGGAVAVISTLTITRERHLAGPFSISVDVFTEY
jgi:hypothetical protein